MTIILFVVAAIAFNGMKIAEKSSFYDDYMSIDNTNAIKGLFLILVFFRHFTGYVKLDGEFDSFFVLFNGNLGQLLVTMFLFYSGYGVMESVKLKKKEYVLSIPYFRAFKVLLHFDIAVLLFVALRYILKMKTTIKEFLLALVCWNSLGNSNWYIMSIVILYLISFVAFIIFREHYYVSAILITILTIVSIKILMPYRPQYCYDTMLCYPLGIWFSLIKNKFDKVILKNNIIYFLALSICFSVFALMYLKRGINCWYYSAWGLAFVLICLLLTTKIKVNNSFLQLLGTHLFSFYILQRLPMWYISKKFLVSQHVWLYFTVSFVITIFISLVFDYFMGKLDGVMFKKKNTGLVKN